MGHRAMAFVDGENLVMRFQEMVKSGRIPLSNVTHVKDVIAWSPQCGNNICNHQLIRATYYTYVTGDPGEVVPATQNHIQSLAVSSGGCVTPSAGCLFPCVFWKKQAQAKAKGVDIQLTVDALTHAHNRAIDMAY